MKTALQNRINGKGGIKSRPLNKVLPGTTASPAREFYRNLEKHYLQNDCPSCASYTQYSVLLVQGQFYHHMELFSVPDQDIFILISQLKESRMINVSRDENTYRITFLKLTKEEESSQPKK